MAAGGAAGGAVGMLRSVMVAFDTLPDILLRELAAAFPDRRVLGMRRLVGFRNVAVHEYLRLDQAVVRTVVEHRLGDFEALCRELVAAS